MIKEVTRKSMKIRHSGRSSDFITPSFGFGCLYSCAYCYMRRHVKKGLSVANNTIDILSAISNHEHTLSRKLPNQTHETLWTYDISCNEDFALHLKYHEWKRIFNFFVNHPRIMATFATKYVNNTLLNYNPNKKVRIRFSLMPQKLSSILEPNTSQIIDRINAVNYFIQAGYEVHLNFSPVIINDSSYNLYKELFHQVNNIIEDKYKKEVKAEVIMLTHNEDMHLYNINNNPKVEDLLWQPEFQENKVSSYGGKNIRYKRELKAKYIESFKKLHNSIISWNEIRYIF